MRGTASLEQDARFTNKDKALVQSTKFPKGFDIKVDMSKVNLEVFKLWIHSKIEELTGSDDDMISEYAISMLQDSSPDPKQMQIQLAGFLTIDNAAVFMTELWKLLVEAQNSPSGVPKALLSLEMERVKKEQEEQEKISRKFQERIPNRYYNSTTSYQQQQIRGTTHHHTAKHPRPYDRSSSNRQQRQTTPSSVSDNAQQEATKEQKEGEKPSLGSERRLNTTDSSDYKRDQSHFRNRYDQHRGNFNSGQQNLVSRRTERRSNSIDFYEKPTFKERADKIAAPPPSSSEEDSDSDGDNYINERRKTVDEFDRLRKRALASMQANSKR